MQVVDIRYRSITILDLEKTGRDRGRRRVAAIGKLSGRSELSRRPNLYCFRSRQPPIAILHHAAALQIASVQLVK